MLMLLMLMPLFYCTRPYVRPHVGTATLWKIVTLTLTLAGLVWWSYVVRVLRGKTAVWIVASSNYSNIGKTRLYICITYVERVRRGRPCVMAKYVEV